VSEHIIQLLIVERDRLERAIEALRGSSPKVLDIYDDPIMPDLVKSASKKTPTPAVPKRKKISTEARRRMAEGQRRRYAAIRAANGSEAAPVAVEPKPAPAKARVLSRKALSPKRDERRYPSQ
jgi:hypothetical protein